MNSVNTPEELLTGFLENDISLPRALNEVVSRGKGEFVYIENTGHRNRLTSAALLEYARRLHGGLIAAGIGPGTPVIIQVEHGARFAVAFWGLLLGGYVPAPLNVPESFHGSAQGLKKLMSVLDTFDGRTVILTDAENAVHYQALADRGRLQPQLVIYENLVEAAPAVDREATAGELALLMFSSGSTGTPKGVRLTHRNLLHNLRQVAAISKLSFDDRSLTWLPYSHDMGLVLFHLTHLLCGITQFKLSPLAFMKDPAGFLRLLSDERVTLTGQPNFAFDHILRNVRTEDLESLDLSALRIIYNGAEPISPALCRKFVATLAPSGLRQDVILPGFGIAEACVCATAIRYGDSSRKDDPCPSLRVSRRALAGKGCVSPPENDDDSIELADLGPPLDGVSFRVADEHGRVLADGQVGVLHMRGSNVTGGYYGLDDDERILEDGWVNTGDLGFSRDGHIFISGRHKDVIFINGRNFYAHDLEAIIQETAGLGVRDAAVCAFRSGDQSEERVVLFVKASRLNDEFVTRLARARAALSAQMAAPVYAVVPVPSLPLTTSGKLQRFALAQRFANGEFDDAAASLAARLAGCRIVVPAETAREEELLDKLARFTGRDAATFSVEEGLVESLGDSLQIARFLAWLQNEGAGEPYVDLTLSDLYASDSIRALACSLDTAAPEHDAPRRGDQLQEPLSRSQQSLWFLENLDGGQAAYNEAYVCTFGTLIDVDRLQGALERAVNRFAALRTVLDTQARPLSQRVLEQVPLSFERLPATQPPADVKARFIELARMRFDFARAPLHRFACWQNGGETQLLFVMPHLIIDGWGLHGFLNALNAEYLGHASQPETLRSLDCYRWIESHRQDREYEQAGAYWKRVFETPLATGSFGRETDEAGETAVYESELAKAEVEALADTARRLGVTPNQLALSAYSLLIAMESAGTDTCVGVTTPGRSHETMLDVVGYLSNTLAVRIDLAAARTLWDVIRQVREQSTALLRWQDFPLAEFIGGSDDPRPPYEAAFSFLPSPGQALSGQWHLRGVERLRGRARIGLLLNIETTASGWRLYWEYDNARFDASAPVHWETRWKALLKALSGDVSQPLLTLKLAIQGRALPESVGSAAFSPRFTCVSDYIDAAVKAFPERAALADDRQTLDYATLAKQVDGLAVYLRGEGIFPGERVAVIQSKSVGLCVSMLAVVKAGGAYVPCDVDYPDERLDAILSAVEPAVVLTDADNAGRVHELLGGRPVHRCCIGDLPDRLAGDESWRSLSLDALPAADCKAVSRADDPVYIHFTSGSTGTPKGVVNTHASVCHLIDWFIAEGLVGEGDIVPQLVSPSFEAFAAELFPTLAAGGTLRVFPPLRDLSPDDIAERFIRDGISVATVSPSYAVQLAGGVKRLAQPPRLRALLFGGEALHGSQIETVRAAFGGAVALYNLYGPTETTVHATCWPVPAETPTEVLLGRPLAGKKILLVDECGMICPPGEPGEIWIGGAGLAQGYWRDQARTERAFISVKLQPSGRTQRFYRSGDLGVQDENGELRYIGRIDHQVKINGQRVELEEVDKALAALPGVDEAAAVVAETRPGKTVLIGCCSGPGAADGEALRAALAERLPAYMVPARFVAFDVLPKSSNAKIDRRALAAACTKNARPAGSGDGEAGGDSATLLYSLWRKVLRCEELGEDPHFFTVGGDSILALELSSELAGLGYTLSPKDIYQNPRLHAQAERIAAQRPRTAGPAAAAASAPVTGSVALTPIQHWFFDLPLKHPEHWLQGVSLSVGGDLDPEVLSSALLKLVNHHDQLRTAFRVSRRNVQQRVREPFEQFALEEFDLSGAADRMAARSEAASTLASCIDLGQCLFAAAAVRLDERRHEIWLVAHHLLVDTVSWRILVSDLRSLYESLSRGEIPSLPRKTSSFQEFADAQSARVDEPGSLEAARGRWYPRLEQYNTAETVFHRPPAPLGEYRSLTLRVDGDDAATLNGIDGALGKARAQDAWLTVVCTALARLSGETTLLVDMESHGRTDPGEGLDLTRSVGWFTALYPCAVHADPEQAPVDTLARIWREQRAFDDTAGFGQLCYLADDPECARLPARAITFNYLGRQESGAGDWAVSPFPAALFSEQDAPPYAVIVQAWQEGGEGVLSLAVHPALGACWSEVQLREALSEQAASLAAACRDAGEVNPLHFEDPALTSAEAAELPADTEDAFPMTPMQEAMFFQTKNNPQSAMYHEQTVYRCTERFDRERLERALALLIERHSMLRAVFRVIAMNRPLQIVLRSRSCSVEEHVLPATEPAEGTPPMVAAYLEEERAGRRFDPEQWPMMRFAIFHGGRADYLVFSFHHILLDGWSQAALVAELLGYYNRLTAGGAPQVEPLRSGMRDHVARLADVTADPQARSFWRERLAGAPVNALPLDRARPAERNVVGAKAARLLDEAVVDRLDAVAAKLGVTANAVCLGAWAYFIHALSGDEDVVTGVVTSGRFAELPDAMKLLGCFLNTLPVRLAVAETDATLADMALKAHEFLLDSRAYEAYPLKEIVKLAQAGGTTPRDRELFQQIYAFENYPTDIVDDRGIELIDGYDMTSYDLTAVLVKRGKSLRVMFEYAPDVLDQATVEYWLEQFASLLEKLSERPETPACMLDLRPRSQIALLDDYNDTAKAYDLSHTLHSLFQEQAARTPEAMAVQDRHGSLTYGHVDSDSNRLAHALQSAGVGDETLVAVVMPRRCDAITAFLGVLKSGGAYVPLDPLYPLERIAGIIEDAGIGYVVTCAEVLAQQSELFGRLPDQTQFFLLDDMNEPGPRVTSCEQWKQGSPKAPRCTTTADRLAYIIYTSGSTGKPKGVMIRHRGAVNTIYAINDMFDVMASDCILGFSSFCFDLSVYDIFGTLARGARLTLATEEDVRDADRLYDWMESCGVTIWNSVPTGIAQLVRGVQLRAHPPVYPNLRVVMMSGEFIPLSLPDEIRAIFPNARQMSLGGATEGSIWSIHYPIDKVDPVWKSIPYGRPLANQGYYVLTEGMQPCLIDQVGMLYITGEGVAIGYFRDEEKTRNAFVPDPLNPSPAPTIYRTGDIGRMRPDGTIEILGRKDMQVKVRGYRIELGEVENQLGKMPDVADAAAVVINEGDYNRLVAFYTSTRGELGTDELTAFLRTRLPEYAIPTRFQYLDTMPLNSSGKIDRRKLPALLESINVEPADAGMLEGELEHAIADAWKRVLRLDNLGPENNFFALGGDSIMSLQVASALAEVGIAVRAPDIVRNPTVRSLATLVASREPALNEADNADSGPIILSPAQRWFFDTLAPASPDYWHLSMELEYAGTIDRQRLSAALVAMVNRHAVLRWQFDGNGGFTEAEHVTEAPILSPEKDETLEDFGRRVREQIRLIPGGQLYAVGVADLPDGSCRLIWAVHHLLVDGVSWRTLLDELLGLYEAPDAPLAPEGSRFAAWSAAVDKLVADFEPSQVPVWRDYLEHDWPLPFADAGTEGQAGRAVHMMSAETTEKLSGVANRALSTQPQDLLLAAALLALQEIVGGQPPALELEHHGRTLGEEIFDLSRTVGWFTAFYPFAIDMTGRTDPIAVVTAVKDAQRAIGDRAADYMVWSRSAPQPAAPQVLFNYLGDLDRLSLRPGWTLADPCAPDRPAGAPRSHAVDIAAHIAGGALTWRVSASGGEVLATRLADSLARNLDAIVQRCSEDVPRKTQSDFPLLWPDETQLSHLQDNVADAYPLTAMQEGMYYAAKADPAAPMYHVHAVATLKMPLDVKRLESALNRVAAAEPMLRTVIVEDGFARPVQVVLENVRYQLDLVDGLEPEQFFAQLPEGVEELSRWPNMYIQISRVGEDTYHFLQFFHHLLFDGWSNGLLFERIMGEYAKLGESAEPARRAAEGFPFARFVEYQLEAGRNREAYRFWREELAGAPALALPVDRLPAAPRDYRTVITNRRFAPAFAGEIREAARRIGCTVSDLILGGLIMLLRHTTGQRDLVFGYCASIRPAELAGIQQGLGMFLNTVPLRMRYDADAPLQRQFSDWRETLARYRNWEHTPLTGIVESVRDVCETFRQGGLRVLYTSETYPAATLPSDIVGIGASNWHMTEFDFALVYSGDLPDGGIHLKFAWANDLFADATIERWYALLEASVAELIGKPASLPEPFPDPLPGNKPRFAELWRRRVQSDPDGLAVDGPHALTVEQLDRAAASVAAAIAGRVRPVALDCADGEWFGVGLVAGLCGGVTVLLLDPQDPLVVRREMADLAGAMVLTDRPQAWAGCPNTTVLDLPALAAAGGEWPEQGNVQQPAYQVATSGTTGEPKIVKIGQDALAHFLHWYGRELDLKQGERVAHLLGRGFDAVLSEWLPALAAGATVVVAPPLRTLGVAAFEAEIKERRFDVLTLPAGYFHLWVNHGPDAGAAATPRLVAIGGEPLKTSAVRTWQENGHEGAAVLLNVYGPAEATIAIGALKIDRPVEELLASEDTPNDTAFMPVGRIGAQLAVLDTSGRVCSVGEPGQIVLRGPQLMDGYLGGGGQLQPFGRCWETGDVATVSSTGAVVVHGRHEDWIKVNGRRVHLKHVEARLAALPGITAVTTAIRHEAEAGGMVAWYVDALERGPAELRRVLAERMPASIIPRLIRVEAIPLDGHGKPDRCALAGLEVDERVRPAAAGSGIWQVFEQTLEQQALDPQYGFFENGGDSLLAVRLQSRLHHECGIHVSIDDLYDAPSLDALAEYLQTLSPASHGKGATSRGKAVEEIAVDEMLY